MITPDYVRLMTRYNTWQNHSLYSVADQLSDADRKQDRGAFFGSIHGTLAHLVFGDQMWMGRLAGTTPVPRARSIAESALAYPDWNDLKADRAAFDQTMSDWSAGLDQTSLEGPFTWYSGVLKREVTKPRWLLVAHMFNHQTHHRGQVHAMLTAAGASPEDTDLMLVTDV